MRGLLSVLFVLTLLAPVCAKPAFDVVVLGSRGGLNESDLSAYLVAPAGEQRYLALDAGSLYWGVHEALRAGSFGKGPLTEGEVIRDRIKAYLISHAHFDHVAGLVLGSPEDSPKPLIGLAPTLDSLKEYVFQPRVWSNFTNEGPGATGKYTLRRVEPGKPFAVEGVPFQIEAYPLSHGPDFLSTAFLVQNGEDALVYCGDTGADSIEGKPYLGNLWKRIAPLVRSGHLRGIFLECSFPSDRKDSQLFGHLTPRLLMQEMHNLAREVGSEAAMKGLTIAVTHTKPSLVGIDHLPQIEEELKEANVLGLRIVFPRQAAKLEL